MSAMAMLQHRVCMVTDFFYPNMGGVESHVFQLSQCLMQRGIKVIIITHAYGDRFGVRWLTGGLKVYYLPNSVMYNQSTLPQIFPNLCIFRDIFYRETVSIVHGHAAFSTLCHEAISSARVLGIRTVFTDHSLFGFADASSIVTNKFLEFSLSDVDHLICVSHTGKENTVLRADMPASIVSVIPNAVDTTVFTPASLEEQLALQRSERIVIVVISRLVYRKGADLLAGLIPVICARHPEVDFLIGGDGPKMLLLEETRERYDLQSRVTLLGTVPHNKVRDVLVKGHVFLNCSLTDAFCMAIVEAASCGLSVVSTKIGGIPEVLPSNLIRLVPPTLSELVEATHAAIAAVSEVDPVKVHAQVCSFYNWYEVAERTEAVYTCLMQEPERCTLLSLQRYYRRGPVSGKIFCCLVALLIGITWILEYLRPRKDIDIAPDFPLQIEMKGIDARRSRKNSTERYP